MYDESILEYNISPGKRTNSVSFVLGYELFGEAERECRQGQWPAGRLPTCAVNVARSVTATQSHRLIIEISSRCRNFCNNAGCQHFDMYRE